MKKLIIASTSAIALFGLAACSDTDETTTESIPEPAVEAPVEPAEEGAVIVDEAEEEPVEAEPIAPDAAE
jgi:hypothetical protein